MKLNQITDNPGSTHPRKRLGRGIGSGLGKTSGKGHKGQKARSGGQRFVGFEGGQMPLYRRLPKRGFTNKFRQEFVVVNVGSLQQAFEQGRLDVAQPIDEATMLAAGLFRRRRDGVRLLAKGELKVPLTLQVTGASAAAVAAVEKAGGTVTVGGLPAGGATPSAASDEGAAPAGPEPA